MLKKLLLTSLSLATITAFADTPDYYMGVQAGYSNTQKSSVNTTVNSQTVSLTPSKHSGAAGRVFVGYAVTPFYAMELGLEKYNNASWQTVANDAAVSDTTLSLYGADISMRFNWLQKSAFSVYNTLGLAYVVANYGSYTDAFALNTSHGFIRPKIGIGGNYSINSATQLNLSYTHVFGKGHLDSAVNAQSTRDYLPTIGMLALGVIYNF